jgi:hypothetical protein
VYFFCPLFLHTVIYIYIYVFLYFSETIFDFACVFIHPEGAYKVHLLFFIECPFLLFFVSFSSENHRCMCCLVNFIKDSSNSKHMDNSSTLCIS